MEYRDVYDIELANKQAGQHFFDRDTMRFFRSRVCGEIASLPNGAALFVTSEQFEYRGDRHARKYTIRMARPDGHIDQVGNFQWFGSRDSAVRMMRKIAEWCAA